MKHRIILLLVVVSFALTLAAAARAEPLYTVDWFTIDSGGGLSSGGPYSLTGSIGQHDAGTYQGGSQYIVNGGFFGGISGVRYLQMIPYINR